MAPLETSCSFIQPFVCAMACLTKSSQLAGYHPPYPKGPFFRICYCMKVGASKVKPHNHLLLAAKWSIKALVFQTESSTMEISFDTAYNSDPIDCVFAISVRWIPWAVQIHGEASRSSRTRNISHDPPFSLIKHRMTTVYHVCHNAEIRG